MNVRDALRTHADPARAARLQRYFRTGKGDYGEGDLFLGLTVPQVRSVVRAEKPSFGEALELLASAYHEERLAALLALVRLYEHGDDAQRKRVYDAYLSNTSRISNWDLVDLSAPRIVGAELLRHGDTKLLMRLARSSNVWERRIAVLATFAFIRAARFDQAFAIAKQVLEDEHDLIHKAAGWMLREIGKRDLEPLRHFLEQHAAAMPRTMLRYAIEKMEPDERQHWMKVPRA